MEPSRGRSWPVWVLAGAGATATLLLLGALLDRGPFSDEKLSQAALIARADHLCHAAHGRFLELQAAPPASLDESAELTAELLEIAEDEQARVEELEAPPELAPLLERYLALRNQGVELLRAGLAAAEAGDQDAYLAAQAELERGQGARFELAREIGFAQCSRPITGPGSGQPSSASTATADP